MATKLSSSLMGDSKEPSPRYDDLSDNRPENPFSSVHRLSTASSSTGNGDGDFDGTSIMTAPPPYAESTGPFNPTLQLQIETPGKPWLSLPLPPHPEPIPIYAVPSASRTPTHHLTPSYLSLRPTRSSGSCFLIAPPSTDSASDEHVPLSTTTYRFGPGRPPLIRLFAPGTATPTTNPFLNAPECSSSSPNDCNNDDDLSAWDTFEIHSLGLLTRAVTFRSRLGTFEWRYASRKERASASCGPTSVLMTSKPHSLLVLDRVVKIASAQNGSSSRTKDETIRTPVAWLVRNDEYRTEGSGPSTAGNGGRLMVDLGLFEREGDGKLEQEMAGVMVVTTALVMLKREVDRRRAQQIAIMAGGAGS